VLAVYNYSPFGLELGGSHQNQTLSFDYTFGGKEANAFAGLTDFGARWLDKPLGVWRQVDPLAELDFDLNSYHYVSNNPISRIDLFGCQDCDANGTDDGNCLEEVVVRGKRTKPDIFFGTLWQSYAYEAENQRVTGRSTSNFHWQRDELIKGTVVITAVVAAPIALELGAAYGGGYLAQLQGTAIGRAILQNPVTGFSKKLWGSKLALSLTSQMLGARLKGEQLDLVDIDLIDILADQILSPFSGALASSVLDVPANGEISVNLDSKAALQTITGFIDNKLGGAIEGAVSGLNLGGVLTNVASYASQLYQKVFVNAVNNDLSNNNQPKQ
jgi:RHS repeat-associated protein